MPLSLSPLALVTFSATKLPALQKLDVAGRVAHDFGL